MTGKRPSAKVIDFAHWAPFCRDAKRKPDAHSMMKAAEHKRILENAERQAIAMAELATLDCLPCDVEPIATTKGD